MKFILSVFETLMRFPKSQQCLIVCPGTHQCRHFHRLRMVQNQALHEFGVSFRGFSRRKGRGGGRKTLLFLTRRSGLYDGRNPCVAGFAG
jgi:hypothetical protein